MQHLSSLFWTVMAGIFSALAIASPRLTKVGLIGRTIRLLREYSFVIAVISATVIGITLFVQRSYREAEHERAELIIEMDRQAKEERENAEHEVRHKREAEVSFSTTAAIASAFNLSSPTAGISCDQVHRESNRTWTITGTVKVFGVTLTHVSGVGPRAFNIGGYDLALLIDDKCPVIDLPPIR